METAVFDELREIARTKAGISLSRSKEALLTARVARRMRALRLPSESHYLALLQNDASGEELVHFLDAVATNFTSFFREGVHFDVLARDLRRRARAGQRRFRLWSAACATGEEAWSMAMVADDVLGELGADCRILATDLSTSALKRARQAQYEGTMMTQIPLHLRLSSCRPTRDGRLTIVPRLRELVALKHLNLSHTPYPMRGPLDAIFCRNVMIYFDTSLRQRLVGEFQRLLRDDGLLFIGHSETLFGLDTALRAVQPSIYSPQGRQSSTEARKRR